MKKDFHDFLLSGIKYTDKFFERLKKVKFWRLIIKNKKIIESMLNITN